MIRYCRIVQIEKIRKGFLEKKMSNVFIERKEINRLSSIDVKEANHLL